MKIVLFRVYFLIQCTRPNFLIYEFVNDENDDDVWSDGKCKSEIQGWSEVYRVITREMAGVVRYKADGRGSEIQG